MTNPVWSEVETRGFLLRCVNDSWATKRGLKLMCTVIPEHIFGIEPTIRQFVCLNWFSFILPVTPPFTVVVVFLLLNISFSGRTPFSLLFLSFFYRKLSPFSLQFLIRPRSLLSSVLSSYPFRSVFFLSPPFSFFYQV